MIQLTELQNGTLEIKIVDREEFEMLITREFTDERNYLIDMLDRGRYLGNNWDAPCNMGLTEMPVIVQGIIYSEDEEVDEPIDYEKVWGYSNYMITSYLEELLENGFVIFDNYS